MTDLLDFRHHRRVVHYLDRNFEEGSMTIDHESAKKLADAYTAAWNSGSPEAVASFYAHDGQIVINSGNPWMGRTGIARMV